MNVLLFGTTDLLAMIVVHPSQMAAYPPRTRSLPLASMADDFPPSIHVAQCGFKARMRTHARSETDYAAVAAAADYDFASAIAREEAVVLSKKKRIGLNFSRCLSLLSVYLPACPRLLLHDDDEDGDCNSDERR